jgi:hypothetical protein
MHGLVGGEAWEGGAEGSRLPGPVSAPLPVLFQQAPSYAYRNEVPVCSTGDGLPKQAFSIHFNDHTAVHLEKTKTSPCSLLPSFCKCRKPVQYQNIQ